MSTQPQGTELNITMFLQSLNVSTLLIVLNDLETSLQSGRWAHQGKQDEAYRLASFVRDVIEAKRRMTT